MKRKLFEYWNDLKSTTKKVLKDFWEHHKHPKKVDRWVSKLNSVLVILIIGMIILGAFWQLGGMVRDSIEEFIQDRFISKLINVQDLIYETGNAEVGVRISPGTSIDSNGDSIFSSFSDLFSGVGWIDQGKTTFYHDKTTTALLFPPKFDWKKVSESKVDESKFIEKRNDGSDRRCIKSECLIQKNNNLFFVSESEEDYESSENRIEFPDNIDSEKLINVSIGNLESKWLVGFVEKNGENDFTGHVYYFDGSELSLVSDESAMFQSEYDGTIGFGGDDDNFLAIYGAYRGQGRHVISGEKVEDISQFFRIRLMNDGFQPQVIKGNNGSWYVYSLTSGNPKFIKLFQNKTNSIAGVVELTDLLSIKNFEAASFYLVSEDPNTLYGKLMSPGGSANYWKFVDEGFDKIEAQSVFSSNINNNPSEVREATIINPEFSPVGADIKFYLSNNKRDWFEVDIGETIQFPDKNGRQLFWKAEAEPNDDPMTSPFLDLIRLKYKIHFL